MKTFSRVLSGSLLIAGTSIGAGMLGIPMVTSECGFGAAVLVTLIVWAFMLVTGLLLLRATLWLPDHSSFLSISRHFLGKGGETVTGILFVFLYYCLMIAYFAAGSHLVAALISSSSVVTCGILFCLFFFTVVFIGPKWIDRVNIGLSIVMFLFWFAMMAMGTSHVTVENLSRSSYSKMWLALPILFGAFGYHNIIPSITSYLGRNKKALVLSILIGTLIPLVVYLFWQWLIIGAIPQHLIDKNGGLPITFALEEITQDPRLFITGQIFALLAITTSILGVSFSLVDFLADGFKKEAKGTNRFWLCVLTFVPPLVFALTFPNIFEKALGIAGGFGEALLNGLLPVALVYVGRYLHKKTSYETIRGGRLLLGLLALFSVIVIVIEGFVLYY